MGYLTSNPVYITTLALDSTSPVQNLAPKITKMWPNLGTGYIDPNEFAKQVVKKITSSGFFGPTTNIWAGKSAFLLRGLELCNLNWAYDNVFARMFGLIRERLVFDRITSCHAISVIWACSPLVGVLWKR